ncbi:MAG TPA: hypothetical protein VIJ93_01395 [bacterium]
MTNSTLPFALKIANLGYQEAARRDPAIQHGLNLEKGRIIHPAVAAAFKSSPRI